MQIQASLFAKADAPLALVHDAEGGMAYYETCISVNDAVHWLALLLECVPWRSLRRPMYERVVEVPRLVANYALSDANLPVCLRRAHQAVVQRAPAPYTHVGLNLYRNQDDSVAPHGDREDSLMPGWPIAILSLGAPRDMVIRDLARGTSLRLSLQPGSLLVMSHASQSTHQHGIPKCREPLGPRISLAFRVRRPKQGVPAEKSLT